MSDRPREVADEDVSFEGSPRSRLDLVGLIAGPATMAAWIWLVPPGRLSPEAHRLAGVLLLTIIWWLSEPIPIAATGLCAVALAVVFGAIPGADSPGFQPARTALLPFADPAVFFLLGGMFLARATSRHGLDRRVALSILCAERAGRSPGSVLFAVGLSVALVSMWVSNTAATAMVYPVTMGIVGVLAAGTGAAGGSFARSRYATSLLLMTAYASSIGGVATPIGTATNVVAMGFFRQPEYLGRPVDFFRWSIVGLPMTIALLAIAFLWLRFLGPPERLDLGRLRAYFRAEQAKLGPIRRGEINALIVAGVVVALWIAPSALALAVGDDARKAFSSRFPEEIVALLAPVLLFLLPVDWRRREFSLSIGDFKQVDWGTTLLFGSAMSLGNLMFATGLAKAAGESAFDLLGTRDPWAITALAIAGGIALSEATSNAAAASTLLPVVWGLCQAAAIDPIPPLFGATFAASFGSALPVSTPPNAIVYGSGLVPIRRMIVAGLGFDVMAGAVVWTVLRVAAALGWTPVLG